MIKLEGTDKLQHYLENSSWWVLETILKFTLLVSILKFRKTYWSILKYRYMIPSLIAIVNKLGSAGQLALSQTINYGLIT